MPAQQYKAIVLQLKLNIFKLKKKNPDRGRIFTKEFLGSWFALSCVAVRKLSLKT